MAFVGMNIPSPWVPTGNFPTTYETFQEGGYRSVATVTEMNNIPALRRKEGMLVRVLATDKVYIYDGVNFVELTEVANIPVDMTGLADGRVLSYDSGTQTFKFVDMGGGPSSSQFVFDQTTPVSSVTIAHNLNMVPAIVIVDSTGNQIYAGVNFPNSNEVTINTKPASTFTLYAVASA